MPTVESVGLNQDLDEATAALIEADDNLADRWRHVEALLNDLQSQSVSQLIAAGSPIVDGFTLPLHEPDDTLPQRIEIADTGLAGNNGTFSLLVPNADLRVVLWYQIDKKRQADGESVLVSFVGSCKIPTDPAPVASAIRDAYESSAVDVFDDARSSLDSVAAKLLGLNEDELSYIHERFLSDPFLSQIRPMWAHRGLHAQGYQDHSGGDRFTS